MKKMDALEFYKSHESAPLPDIGDLVSLTVEEICELMEQYHQSKVNNGVLDDDESNDKQEVIKLNNSYQLLKKFKLYYDKVENNIKYSDSHDDRVVSEFITEELINNGKI